MRSNKHKHQKIIAAGLTGGGGGGGGRGGGGGEKKGNVVDNYIMLVLACNTNENPSLFAAL